MNPPLVSIEATDGMCVRVLTDIGHVLALSEQTETRLPRALELLRQMVDCKHCALLIETTSQQQLFASVPMSHGIAEPLRGRLRQLLQTVREQAPEGAGLAPYHVAAAGRRIVRLYEAWGRTERATAWRTKLHEPGEAQPKP